MGATFMSTLACPDDGLLRCQAWVGSPSLAAKAVGKEPPSHVLPYYSVFTGQQWITALRYLDEETSGQNALSCGYS